MHSTIRAAIGLAIALGSLFACGSDDSSDPPASDPAEAGATGEFGPAGGAIPQAPGLPPPQNFVKTEYGGYALGAAITGDGAANVGVSVGDGQSCRYVVGVVRDFKGADVGGHPDFEADFSGNGPTEGLVATALGANGKPTYASQCEATLTGGKAACPSGQQTTSKAAFDQWYRYTPDVNKPYLLYLEFAPNGGVFTFESKLYFPVDNAGWGNSAKGTDKKLHNFGFTTELHTEFLYNGGESFTFTGDDDVWVFMNHRLAMDLGGLHRPASGTIAIDQAAATLGLTKGNKYPLELFQAERHSAGSNFRIDTNLAFTNCGTVPVDAPN